MIVDVGRVYLANAFSLSMLLLKQGEAAQVCVKRIGVEDAKRIIEDAMRSGIFECAIGHASTAQLAADLLDMALLCGRTQITMKPGDTIIALTLTFRPPEGKVYSYDELMRLYGEGKIAFYAVYYGSC